MYVIMNNNTNMIPKILIQNEVKFIRKFEMMSSVFTTLNQI